MEGLGGWDIYSFKLYNEAKPERVIFLSGYLTDENQNFVDSVDIEIKNMRTNEIEIISVENGSYSYFRNLNLSEDLLITIKKDGYSFHSSYISSDDTLFSSPAELDIKLDSLESNKSFTIENIYFDNNSYQIKPLSEQVLVEFSKYLLINNSLKIEISGFTDDVGGDMQKSTFI